MAVAASALSVTACQLSDHDFPAVTDDGRTPIVLSGEIDHQVSTKVSDAGFADGDQIGIYIVNYDGDIPGELVSKGNWADNVRFTFDEAAWKWSASYDLYWKDSRTPIDVYGYYPFSSPGDVTAYPFEVQKDQSTSAANGLPGGYEASDFLWAKSAGNAPTDKTINLKFKHMMAGIRVTLVEGTGFADGEWAAAEKSVLVRGTTRKSTIDLRSGTVTATGEPSAAGIVTSRSGNDFRAVAVPQTLAAGNEILAITVAGTSYSFKKTEDVVLHPSKLHNFTMTVNKRAAAGGYEFVLTSESITVWESDEISHDATAKAYVVINVPEAGTLDACIEAAGKDVSKVRNLKITGQINSRDFAVMRFKMTWLRALNLKEVRIVAGPGGCLDEKGEWSYGDNQDDDVPSGALHEKTTLVSLVLPDRLKRISGSSGGGYGAFSSCTSLTGSLVIPEGVEYIGPAAFHNDVNLTGTLSLPSTLKQIGEDKGYISYWDGTFFGCGFVSELKIPDSVEVIGMGAFSACRNLYGELRLPRNLRLLGESAFSDCENLQGSLEIPQGVTDIPDNCFNGTWLGGTLTLHDGISTIGSWAFSNTGFRGELRLPKNLESLSAGAFYNCDFSGELVLPEGLRIIGDKCFAFNWRLMGVLEIPSEVISIGAGAFAQCRSLEGVIFPAGLENIQANSDWGQEDAGAFQNCFGIGRIVCKGSIPAYVMERAFYGVPKDNFTLEVPEAAIQQYQTATGWKDFKRISAYRNLVVRPSMATAINTTATRDLVLNADEDWYVESMPDWVSLDKTFGTQKTELKLTFSQMPQGSETREGEIVFKLKSKDYTTRCRVSQYDYDYAEDEFITLQSATRGEGINIVLLGDGYSAQDIYEGKLLANVEEAYGYFFDIEPYKSYKDYFNVYTAVSVSPESGIGSVNTIINNRFNTTAKGGVTLGGRYGDSDFNLITRYITGAPTVNGSNLGGTLVIMVPNTSDYGGICYMYDDGFAIAYCPMSQYGYPLDFRGVVQHEAGGHGFGKLGDEYIYHNAFIDACDCTCCGHVMELLSAKAKGWYANLELSGKFNEVGWSHLIFHEKYNQFVDVFEGGFMHNRGVFRSEQNSCMNNDIPYYSTISRQAIVQRIKELAGETFSLEEFIEKDVTDATVSASTKAGSGFNLSPYRIVATQEHEAPVFMGSRPAII